MNLIATIIAMLILIIGMAQLTVAILVFHSRQYRYQNMTIKKIKEDLIEIIETIVSIQTSCNESVEIIRSVELKQINACIAKYVALSEELFIEKILRLCRTGK